MHSLHSKKCIRYRLDLYVICVCIYSRNEIRRVIDSDVGELHSLAIRNNGNHLENSVKGYSLFTHGIQLVNSRAE